MSEEHRCRQPFLMTTVLPYMVGQTLGLMLGLQFLPFWLAFRISMVYDIHRLSGSQAFTMVAVTPCYNATYIAACVFGISRQCWTAHCQKWVQFFRSHAWYPSLNSLGGAIFTLSLCFILMFICQHHWVHKNPQN